MNRRKFLQIALGATAAAIVSGLGIYEVLKTTVSTSTTPTSQTSSLTTNTSVVSSSSYPLGNRSICILRLIGFDNAAYSGAGRGSWGASSYSAEDILNWLSELQPTTSYRYTGIVRSQDAGVLLGDLGGYPSNDNSGWASRTVLDFTQAYIDTMRNPVAVYPRLSWDLDGNGSGGGAQFQQLAQQMLQFQQMLDPPFEMLSIDDFQNEGDVVSVLDNLYSMGWKGLALGACGVDPTDPNLGKETWGFLCLDQSGNPANPSRASETLNEVETKWDTPNGIDMLMSNMKNNDASGVATAIENAAKAQSTLGSNVHLCYPIYANGVTSTCYVAELTCKTKGDYWNSGDSLLTAIKNMMNEFNS